MASTTTSAPLLKKRGPGRPRKLLVEEPIDILTAPAKATGTRAKSTMATVSTPPAPKPAKPAKPIKAAKTKKPATTASSAPQPLSAEPAAKKSKIAQVVETLEQVGRAAIEESRILRAVREEEAAKRMIAAQGEVDKPSPATQAQASKSVPASTPTKKMSKTIPPPLPYESRPPISSKKIPITGLNRKILDNISRGAGARGTPHVNKPLPAGYNKVARRVTTAIVAMPVLLVTSWVLYERLILGKEAKQLPKWNEDVKVKEAEKAPELAVRANPP